MTIAVTITGADDRVEQEAPFGLRLGTFAEMERRWVAGGCSLEGLLS
jgi:hypothetical protein